MIEYGLVTADEALAELCRKIGDERDIAVDLEMDSLHSYREKVCLVQLSTRSGNWIIDPLALSGLSPLAELLAKPSITAVLHGADYDIRSIHRDYGVEIGSVFDTMIAARFAGVREFGLSALLKSRFDVELDKRYQKADWSVRPLTPEMCAYAAADTAYLLDLADDLRRELMSLERLSWLEEECSIVRGARVAEKEGPLFLHCKGSGKLSGRSLALLEKLLCYRDVWAEKMDRPPFKVFSAEILLEIAEKFPATLQDLSGVRGMSQRLLERHSRQILGMVSESLAMPASEFPRYPVRRKPETSDRSKRILKRFKEWREEMSARLGLEPGVLAPNWMLEAIAGTVPADLDGLAKTCSIRQWQMDLFGKELLDIAAACENN